MFGVSNLLLDVSLCKQEECVMGDIITDAYLHQFRKKINYTKPAASFILSGGIRGGLMKGCKWRTFYLFSLQFFNYLEMNSNYIGGLGKHTPIRK